MHHTEQINVMMDVCSIMMDVTIREHADVTINQMNRLQNTFRNIFTKHLHSHFAMHRFATHLLTASKPMKCANLHNNLKSLLAHYLAVCIVIVLASSTSFFTCKFVIRNEFRWQLSRCSQFYPQMLQANFVVTFAPENKTIWFHAKFPWAQHQINKYI